ncbi:MAG: HlyD family efflux transporter periplasmic adaptor subunit [Deltaproteobacteria bacterium]|nr:HlyD family efflux transporter periplasmic adaptor subunit [Deltaproteobacteria bacterium]MBI3294343.1 HlyD family efflux transporter periplasmic adaptor subunit [Deltaproteobacteria bacterium]
MKHTPILLMLLGRLASANTAVPFTVETMRLSPTVELSGSVEPKVSSSVKIRWYALIKKLGVDLNQMVKEGDLIAEVSLDYLDYRMKYFEGRIGFAKAAAVDTIKEELLILKQKRKVKGLVAKGIVASQELDKLEVTTVDTALKRIRAEKEVKDLQKQIDETRTQMKDANYYAPIAGVVTEMMVNPRQISGVVIAMPDSKLCRIDQPGLYRATAVAMDTQAVHLVPGMRGTVIFEGTGERIEGNVSEITQNLTALKNGVQLFDVQFEFKKPGPILARGFAVRVEIPYGEAKAVATVPWSALRDGNDSLSVLKYDRATGWDEVPVKVGIRGRHRVEIVQGLKAGDIVSAELW